MSRLGHSLFRVLHLSVLVCIVWFGLVVPAVRGIARTLYGGMRGEQVGLFALTMNLSHPLVSGDVRPGVTLSNIQAFIPVFAFVAALTIAAVVRRRAFILRASICIAVVGAALFVVLSCQGAGLWVVISSLLGYIFACEYWARKKEIPHGGGRIHADVQSATTSAAITKPLHR